MKLGQITKNIQININKADKRLGTLGLKRSSIFSHQVPLPKKKEINKKNLNELLKH